MTESIVVGVDGSASSRAALSWAFAYAAGRPGDVAVKVVSAWQYPYTEIVPAPLGGTIGAPASLMQLSSEEALATILDEVGVPEGLTVERVVCEGSAARVLLAEAKGASMLVVGARGHGGFAGLLIGSVATQCVHHAAVPTVVVPAA